ncbi:MAG: hypothetical protein Q7J65_05560 [Candidatus Marinimicrobia bacterium]|nr:hypothetical protein [Candidatus Neomarinimicrobiota bacterium]
MKRTITGIVCLICGLLSVSCYNNAHLRTTKPLEDGERANSFSVVSAIGGPAPGQENYSGISGLRVEASFLKGTGTGDQGPYLGAGLAGSDGTCYIAGYDKSRYIHLNNKIPCKLGIQGEIDISSGVVNGVGIQLRPFLTSMVSDAKWGYYGIHALLSYGNIDENISYYSDENGNYKLSSVGLGFTAGKERPNKKTSLQYQYDISLVRSYLLDRNITDTKLMLSFSLGLNSFNKPKKIQSRIEVPYGIQEIENQGKIHFDPETGLPADEINQGKNFQQFDPVTGLPVEPKKSKKPSEFDPETGLPIPSPDPTKSEND